MAFVKTVQLDEECYLEAVRGSLPSLVSDQGGELSRTTSKRTKSSVAVLDTVNDVDVVIDALT